MIAWLCTVPEAVLVRRIMSRDSSTDCPNVFSRSYSSCRFAQDPRFFRRFATPRGLSQQLALRKKSRKPFGTGSCSRYLLIPLDCRSQSVAFTASPLHTCSFPQTVWLDRFVPYRLYSQGYDARPWGFPPYYSPCGPGMCGRDPKINLALLTSASVPEAVCNPVLSYFKSRFSELRDQARFCGGHPYVWIAFRCQTRDHKLQDHQLTRGFEVSLGVSEAVCRK